MTKTSITDLNFGIPASRWPFMPHATGFVGISVARIMVLVAAGSPTPLLPIYEQEWSFPAWMLTLAFGVYALALLVAILVIGSLSDHIGRRPLMIGALALELVAMLMFLYSPGIGWLIAARIVQGIATGAASSSLSAAVVELAPERYKKTGALMTSLAPLAGLGIGSLFAGILAQTERNATFTVWLVLTIIMAMGTLFTLFTPETSTRKPGAWLSLIPRVSLPRQVRAPFGSALAGLAGAFMTMSLFLGLVPVLLAAIFGVTTPIVGALAAFVAFGVGTLVSAVTTSVKPHRLRLLGATTLTIGAMLFIASIGALNLPLLWAAAAFGGAGIGAQFSGTTRGLVPEVKPHERAALFSMIYLVGYLAMGLSAIIAGAFVSAIGASTMAIWFGIILAAISVVAIITTVSHRAGQRN